MDDETHSQPKIINAMEARRTFGEILEKAYYKGDQFIIERAGKPMAALVPLSHLQALQKNADVAKVEHDTIPERKRRSNKRRAWTSNHGTVTEYS